LLSDSGHEVKHYWYTLLMQSESVYWELPMLLPFHPFPLLPVSRNKVPIDS
jgi:hypothetical protein